MAITQNSTRALSRAVNRTRRRDGHGAVPVETVQGNDALVTADGVQLGAVLALYQGSTRPNHLFVQGPAGPDDQGAIAVYVVPLSELAGRDGAGHSLWLAASAAEARQRWLTAVMG
jgi:hypothetical protein